MSYNTVTIPGQTRISSTLQGVFSFPNPVNERAARLVAAMVFVTAGSIILFDAHWLTFFLAYGTFGFGQPVVAEFVLGTLVVFAGLEAFLGFCMGCFVFGYLMQWGFISEETCERCNNWAVNL